MKIIEEIKQDKNLFRRRLYLLLFLSKALQLIGTKEKAPEALPSHIMEAISYLQSNYSKKIIAEDLAHKIGVSRTKLITTFKKYTEITLNSYLTQYRLREAIRCLMEGETVQIVAEKCGFGDSSNFIRAFHAQYNTTPMQYFKKTGLRKRADCLT